MDVDGTAQLLLARIDTLEQGINPALPLPQGAVDGHVLSRQAVAFHPQAKPPVIALDGDRQRPHRVLERERDLGVVRKDSNLLDEQPEQPNALGRLHRIPKSRRIGDHRRVLRPFLGVGPRNRTDHRLAHQNRVELAAHERFNHVGRDDRRVAAALIPLRLVCAPVVKVSPESPRLAP